MKSCALKMGKLILNVFGYRTLLHATTLWSFQNTWNKLIRWPSGWGTPFKPINLLVLPLLMKTLSTFQFFQVSLVWHIRRWRCMETTFELMMNIIIC
jgi:hypothetical protein